jgi:hypothetical protein
MREKKHVQKEVPYEHGQLKGLVVLLEIPLFLFQF